MVDPGRRAMLEAARRAYAAARGNPTAERAGGRTFPTPTGSLRSRVTAPTTEAAPDRRDARQWMAYQSGREPRRMERIQGRT